MTGSFKPFAAWRAGALVGLAPLHAFLFLAIQDAAGARSAVFGTWADVILYGLYGVLTGWAALLFLRGGAGPRMWGLTAAIILLPKYLWMFPDCWPLALAGILLCLGHGRYVMRRAAAASDEAAPRPARGWPRTDRDAVGLVVLSCWGTAFGVLVSHGYRLGADAAGLGLVWLIAAASVVGSLVYEFTQRLRTGRRPLAVPMVLLVLALVCGLHPDLRGLLLPVLAVRQIAVGLLVWMDEGGGTRMLRYLLDRPAQLFVSSFLLVIVGGAVLLSLPAAAAAGVSVGAVDALFTAASATCVTGLTVLDTGGDFSLFGQLTILALIQVGGLGVMTISTFLALMLGQSIGGKGEFAVQEMVGDRRTRTALRLVRFIVLSTLAVEAAGAIVLTGAFWAGGEAVQHALSLGLFHAVSAFCNAGFSTFSAGLAGTAATPAVLLTVSLLVILGGLGFSVLYGLLGAVRGSRTLAVHTRLVLVVTVLLLAGGTLLLWFLERERALATMAPGQAWLHAWFQAVMPRTAGFNSIDLTLLGTPARMVLVVLMFIGAAPGSTAGGIKVTTVAVLALVVRSVFADRDSACAGGRRISPQSVYRAVALLCLALALVASGTLLLLLTERSQRVGDLLFEAVSAFGTVGLSLGVTPRLTALGKFIIVGLMFVGRVGPLTLLLMARPAFVRSRLDYPQTNVMIG